MKDERKILVTGASGYVGGRLVTALLEDGSKLTSVDSYQVYS